MFNGHMDTSTSGRESPDLPIGLLPNAVIEDGWLYGLGASNMKAAFSAYYGAIRMIQSAGIKVSGKVIVSGVVGEIEKAPVARYQGGFYRGGGCGANYAVQHGLMADVVIIGEPTGMRIQNAASSYMFCRVGAKGIAQHTWSRERGVDALDKGMFLLNALRAWEPEFERLVAGAKIGARLTVGAIEGGFPYKPSIAPAPMCDIFLDLRFPPNHTILEIANLVRRQARRAGAREPRARSDLRSVPVPQRVSAPGGGCVFPGRRRIPRNGRRDGNTRGRTQSVLRVRRCNDVHGIRNEGVGVRPGRPDQGWVVSDVR